MIFINLIKLHNFYTKQGNIIMVKALKNLTYLIFCASLSATIYAMDPPLAEEESSSPPVQTNLLNSV
jgi:hypothetical protein